MKTCPNFVTHFGRVSREPVTLFCKHILLPGETECICCAELRLRRLYDHEGRGMCSGRDDRPEDRAYHVSGRTKPS
jgi:hypothetical protein